MKGTTILSVAALGLSTVSASNIVVVQDNQPCDGNVIPLGAVAVCASKNYQCRWRAPQVLEGKHCLPVAQIKANDRCDPQSMEQKCALGLTCQLEPPHVANERGWRCQKPVHQAEIGSPCDPKSLKTQCPEGTTCKPTEPQFVAHTRAYVCSL